MFIVKYDLKEIALNIIYEPRGAAKEYSPLALNLYEGCEHGCKYCYAPSCRYKKKSEFFGSQSIRKNVLDKLEPDLKKMNESGNAKRTLLCFTCDPYQHDDDFNMLTRDCLELFKKYKQPFQVLTKGGMKAVRDFDLYKPGDAYAATLTFDSPERSMVWEPNAALPVDRMDSLKAANDMGIETWASFEPVIDPKDTFKLIDKTHEYVDLYKVGKINRFKTGIDVDWKKFTIEVIDKLEQLGKKYYIKDSLKQFL